MSDTGRDGRGRDDEGPLLGAENPALLFLWNTFPSGRGVHHIRFREVPLDETGRHIDLPVCRFADLPRCNSHVKTCKNDLPNPFAGDLLIDLQQ